MFGGFMNLDPIKPIGGFIENTIRPMLSEAKWFFKECEKKGIKINENNVVRIIDYVSRAHIRTCLIHLLQSVIITVIICLTYLAAR